MVTCKVNQYSFLSTYFAAEWVPISHPIPSRQKKPQRSRRAWFRLHPLYPPTDLHIWLILPSIQGMNEWRNEWMLRDTVRDTIVTSGKVSHKNMSIEMGMRRTWGENTSLMQLWIPESVEKLSQRRRVGPINGDPWKQEGTELDLANIFRAKAYMSIYPTSLRSVGKKGHFSQTRCF